MGRGGQPKTEALHPKIILLRIILRTINVYWSLILYFGKHIWVLPPSLWTDFLNSMFTYSWIYWQDIILLGRFFKGFKINGFRLSLLVYIVLLIVLYNLWRISLSVGQSLSILAWRSVLSLSGSNLLLQLYLPQSSYIEPSVPTRLTPCPSNIFHEFLPHLCTRSSTCLGFTSFLHLFNFVQGPAFPRNCLQLP